ncbi:hypothetical protein [Streptomyces filamentosus]|uniref:hypothetical protein n=1 Tax=Streptomyces filamentosus TaxID=67294 RepID=UPI0037D66343
MSTAAAAGPLPAAGVLAPPPEEETCPDGTSKPPCPAGDKEEAEVEAKEKQVEKDQEQAKKDMAAAKEKTEECPPSSKKCMDALAGDGAEQKQGMKETREELDAVQSGPEDNASAAIDGSCDGFAADLPPALVSSDPQLTHMCKVMNP